MTNLLSPAQTNVSTQQRVGLNPETKSALFAATMSGVLGGTWFAHPVVDGGYSLIKLDKDKFEKTTKKISSMPDATPEKIAFTNLNSLRKGEAATQIVDELFGEKAELSQKELLGNFKTKERLEQYIQSAEKRKAKSLDMWKPLTNIDKTTILTDEHFKLISKDKYTERLVETFKKLCPEKATVENLANFLIFNTTPEKTEAITIKNILARTGNADTISKGTVQKIIKESIIDNNLEQINTWYATIKDKLPKDRLKGAAKWFGLGFAISVATDMIFNLLGKKSTSK